MMDNALVLVVDDDPVLREFLTAALEQEGYAVVSAENGRAALDRLDQDTPVLMLLDMQMPLLDGRGVLERLEARPARPGVIVMSADERYIDWCRGSGADVCLSKPFTLTTLMEAVHQVYEAH